MQKNYTSRYARAVAGQLEGFGSPAVRTFKNSALDVLWSYTLAIPSSVDNSATYSVQLSGGDLSSGITASFTTDGSATQSELLAGLLAAIRASEIHDKCVSAVSGNSIVLTSRKSGLNYTISAPSNASTTNDLTGSATPFVNSSAIDFGRFVVRTTASDGFNEARLPASNSGVVVQGVTLAPRAAVVKDRLGNDAKPVYYPNEAMDVAIRSNDTTGVWVEAEAGISASTAANAIYIDCNTAGKLGSLTLTATNNLALPAGVAVVEGSTPGVKPGTFLVLVSLNLP